MAAARQRGGGQQADSRQCVYIPNICRMQEREAPLVYTRADDLFGMPNIWAASSVLLLLLLVIDNKKMCVGINK